MFALEYQVIYSNDQETKFRIRQKEAKKDVLPLVRVEQ